MKRERLGYDVVQVEPVGYPGLLSSLQGLSLEIRKRESSLRRAERCRVTVFATPGSTLPLASGTVACGLAYRAILFRFE